MAATLLEKASAFEADMKFGLDHCGGEDAAVAASKAGAEADMKFGLDHCAINAVEESPFIVDVPRITTMTVQVSITPSVSLQKLNANFTKPEVTAYVASAFPSPLVMKKNKKTTLDGAQAELTRASFYNCIIFSYRDGKEKASSPAIKVFSNGTLHITGLKTITEVLAISELFCRIFEIVSGEGQEPSVVKDFKGQKPFSVEDFRVQLVNSHFKIPSLPHISLDKLHRHLLTETQHLCRYNRENHAGLIIRMDLDTPGATTLRHISVIIFESGNVIISAFTHSSELIRAYEFVVGFLKKHAASVAEVDAHEATAPIAKRRRRTVEGFDYGKYIMLK
jgi:TATA-box binding protein (TBP) (component of TFIID and TFIIIB)